MKAISALILLCMLVAVLFAGRSGNSTAAPVGSHRSLLPVVVNPAPPTPLPTLTPMASNNVYVLPGASYFEAADGRLLKFIGEIQNDGNVAINNVALTITLKDVNGTVVASRRAFGLPARVQPQDKSCFGVAFTVGEAEGWASYQIEDPQYNLPPSPIVELLPQGIQSSVVGSDDLLLEGTITNPGATPLTSVYGGASVYDQRGTLLDCASTRVVTAGGGFSLAAGETAPLSVLFDARPDYEDAVTWRIKVNSFAP